MTCSYTNTYNTYVHIHVYSCTHSRIYTHVCILILVYILTHTARCTSLYSNTYPSHIHTYTLNLPNLNKGLTANKSLSLISLYCIHNLYNSDPSPSFSSLLLLIYVNTLLPSLFSILTSVPYCNNNCIHSMSSQSFSSSSSIRRVNKAVLPRCR